MARRGDDSRAVTRAAMQFRQTRLPNLHRPGAVIDATVATTRMLHTVTSAAADITAATYASALAARTLPKHRLPDQGVPAEVARAIVSDELLLDGNSRQNLATFCT